MFKVCVVLLVLPLSQVQSRELSYPQQLYHDGLVYMESGNLSEGKNVWTKYRAFCRLSPTDCDPVAQKNVGDYFMALKDQPIQKAEETKAPVVLEVTTPAAVKSANVSKPKAPKVEAPSRPANPSKLVKEAERAREQGQLEAALRYYALAEKINPNTEEFKEPIAELRRLME